MGGFSKSLATGLRLGYVVSPERYIEKLLQAIRATTWNAPALISGIVTGWIEDGTLEISEVNRRRDGAERQKLCRKALGTLPVISHPNAGFAWLPLERRIRAEPIIANLADRGISVSGADPFATSVAVPQALRLAFGGIPKEQLVGVLGEVRDAIEIVSKPRA